MVVGGSGCGGAWRERARHWRIGKVCDFIIRYSRSSHPWTRNANRAMLVDYAENKPWLARKMVRVRF